MFIQKLCCRNWQKAYCLIGPNKQLCSPQQLGSSQSHVQSSRSFKRISRTQFQKPEPKENSLAPKPGPLTPFENIHVETGSVPPINIAKATIFALMFSAGSFVSVSVWEYENLRSRLARGRKNWRRDMKTWWNKLTIGEKVFAPICAVNLIVFGLWRIPAMQQHMVKWFCSNPAAKSLCWPMCLSTFSHYSLFHLFANMYVLHSFANVAVASLGKEQFLGLYLSAGVISSWASYVYKASISKAGLSLGASGAIMAILGYVCCEYPETQLSILFLPMFTFSAGIAIKVIMGLDLAGILLGWKFFDHAAHLGGAMFGMFWCYYGKDHIWPERERILKEYHLMRSSK